MKLDTPKNKENNLEYTVNWKTKSIKSLCLKVTSGGTPSRKNPSFYEEGTIPWLKTKELKDWYIDDSEEKITLEALNNSSAKIFPQNTVLMAMYGDGKTITSLGILRNEAATNQACCALITNSEVCDHLFLFYSLKFHRQDFISMASGGSQRNLNGQLISNFTIKVPPLETQQKIASILSNYDDLIENNTRRIEILERMAKLVYEEWFVKFRFPGHEKVKIIDGVPDGWKIKKIGNIFTVVLGGTPSRKKEDYWNGNIPWINSGKVNELRIINESEGITELGLKKSATKMMPVRTTVLAITGVTLGQISLTEIEVCANQSVVGIYDEKRIYSEYIFLKIKEIINEVILKAGGGAQQHINKEIINETEVIIPPENVVEEFNSFIMSIFNQISILLFKNQNLRKTRDLLLPKLISGEIDISDLDIRIKNEYQENKFNFGEPQDEKGFRVKMV
ncbi:hypothetical protein ASJ81_06825 [Methanosarcina spelaei]|uniref:Type I restriction modification DNA specificity domain-containing protein n=1 Tax=Methanosarcina spelaei TaxID=1036679 RepID=A0A2A2HS18_9EURY|nr:restriction endonuclease subunit S [Methanosarcina spelaei]PAV12289.1 hypothetical protein ASJ81_06825 [Methanosarcina spelaei]